jgi:hypothetical protein
MTDRLRVGTSVAILLAIFTACAQPDAPEGAASASTSSSTPSAIPTNTLPAAPTSHLQIRETQFVRADGVAFHWRGISAFRLVEMIARGRRDEVVAYLDWAAAHHVSVVRVLTMATHLFSLRPEDGVRALPELLELAAKRGLYVEVVALADTKDVSVEIEAHVRAIGAVAAAHPNALVEIANEPIHSTQAPRLHDPAEVARLAQLIPDNVPVALGSAEENERFSGGDYATFHFPRESGRGGWGHVVALAEGATLLERWKKPLVNDEPMGAAPELIPGRRDDNPTRFRAAALLTRLTGMGATFHYEGGLQARIATGRELECLEAWNQAWTLLPADVEAGGTFRRAGDPEAAVRAFASDSALAVVERQRGNQAWVLVVDVRGEPALRWRTGWTPTGTRRLDGAWLITATRSE